MLCTYNNIKVNVDNIIDKIVKNPRGLRVLFVD